MEVKLHSKEPAKSAKVGAKLKEYVKRRIDDGFKIVGVVHDGSVSEVYVRSEGVWFLNRVFYSFGGEEKTVQPTEQYRPTGSTAKALNEAYLAELKKTVDAEAMDVEAQIRHLESIGDDAPFRGVEPWPDSWSGRVSRGR